MDWVSAVQQIGIGSVCLLGMGWFTNRQITREQKRTDEREKEMTARIQHLEDEFRKTLIPLVQKTQEVITENTVAMERATVAFGIGKETRDKIKGFEEHR